MVLIVFHVAAFDTIVAPLIVRILLWQMVNVSIQLVLGHNIPFMIRPRSMRCALFMSCKYVQ